MVSRSCCTGTIKNDCAAGTGQTLRSHGPSTVRCFVSSSIESLFDQGSIKPVLAKMSSHSEKPHTEGVSQAEPTTVTYGNPESEDDCRAVFEEIDKEEERKIVKKIDMVVMPILAIVYLFQCMMLYPFALTLEFAQTI